MRVARNGGSGAEMVGVKRVIVVVGPGRRGARNASEVRDIFRGDEESMGYVVGA